MKESKKESQENLDWLEEEEKQARQICDIEHSGKIPKSLLNIFDMID